MLLITGATGHTGTHVIQKLKAIKFQEPIRCIVRKDSDLSVLNDSRLNIERCEGTLTDFAFVNSCMKNVDNVLHIAGIHWSENITRSALANRVDRVVYVHTTGRFSRFKSAAEEYIRIEEDTIRSGIPYTILRPTMIYGSQKDINICKLIEYIDTHTLFPIFGDGQNLMQPILSRDLAEAVVSVYFNKEKTLNKCYDVAGKYPLTYERLLRTISAGLGRNTLFIKIPYVISILGAVLYNAISPSAKISVEQVMRMNEERNFSYDSAAADFGFNPSSFDDGVAEQIRQYLETKVSRR